MKWATNETLGNQGPPAAWLIRRFIDADAEILLLPKATALAEAARVGARTFYVKGGDFYKDARRTTFDALMEAYGLVGKDPALDRMAEITAATRGACGRGRCWLARAGRVVVQASPAGQGVLGDVYDRPQPAGAGGPVMAVGVRASL